MSKALEASSFIAAEITTAPQHDQVMMLARPGRWLLKIIVLAGFYAEAAELSRSLIEARLADEGEEVVDIDVFARLVGMVAAVNLGNDEVAQTLFGDLVEGGELALKVINEWLTAIETGGGVGRQGQIASALNVKGANLAESGRTAEALELLNATKQRFATDTDPLVLGTLLGTDQIITAIQAEERG